MVDTADWRSGFQPGSRQRTVNNILKTLKRHLPFSGQEGLHQFKKIAVRLEENIYISATSQSDYHRQISLEVLTFKRKSQNAIANSLPSNCAGNGKNPLDPASLGIQSQVHTMDAGDWRSQLQCDSRTRIVNKIMETLKNYLPFSGLEGLYELKKIALRFEEKVYHAATSQSDYLRKISLKMLTMEVKSQNTMANSLQSNSASNGKNLLDPGIRYAASVTQSTPLSSPPQSQQSSVQHSTQSMHQQRPQSVIRQPPHVLVMHQQQMPMTQQTTLSLQEQQLMRQQPDAVNMQQSQLFRHQNSVSNMQQKQQQQQGLLDQQNNLPNLLQQQQQE